MAAERPHGRSVKSYLSTPAPPLRTMDREARDTRPLARQLAEDDDAILVSEAEDLGEGVIKFLDQGTPGHVQQRIPAAQPNVGKNVTTGEVEYYEDASHPSEEEIDQQTIL